MQWTDERISSGASNGADGNIEAEAEVTPSRVISPVRSREHNELFPVHAPRR